MTDTQTQEQLVCRGCGYTAPLGNTPTGAPTCPKCRIVLVREAITQGERADIAERVLQAVEKWRAENKPRCAESCWQMDRCVIEAPALVESVMEIAGYYNDED